jgi:hypothetical protein
MRLILAGICLLGFSLPSLAAPVTPNFTSGTVTSHTESTTTVTEIIKQQDFQTGFTYTVTGTNINIPGTPTLGTGYTIVNQGEPFQFSETYMGPGLVKETTVNRTTTIQSVTDSMSVFTQ